MRRYYTVLLLIALGFAAAKKHKYGDDEKNSDAERMLPWALWKENKHEVHHNRIRHRPKETNEQNGLESVNRRLRTGKVEEKKSLPYGTSPRVSPFWIDDACAAVYQTDADCGKTLERYSLEYSLEGDIMLAGLFPVHYGLSCQQLEEMGSIQRMEAMAYAVQRVNSWKGFMKNLTLGFRIFDTCNSQSIALAKTLSVLPHCDNCTLYPVCFPECPPVVTGIVGPESSSNTLLAAHSANLALTPIISYFATSVELKDQTLFPTLFTTVPSDDHQVSAMLELLEHFGWSYFSIVHTDDRYGKDALDYIQLNMKEMCLAAVIQVSSTAGNESYDAAVRSLMQYKVTSDASVVVVFTDGRAANKLFEAVERADVVGEFVWIGSEGWGVSLNDINGMLHVAQGAVTFTPHTEMDPQFDRYFQALGINHTSNPWWKEIWSAHFDCFFNVSRDDENSCYQYDHIQLSNGYVPDSTVALVNDAVYAFAYAISDYVNKTDDLYDDDGKAKIPPWKLINYIRHISFPGSAQRGFTSLGDPVAYYDVNNLQAFATGHHRYVNVGYWTTTEGLVLQEQDIQWPGMKETTPKSYCSKNCDDGEIQVLLKIACCWECQECPKDSYVLDGTKCKACPKLYWPNHNRSGCEKLPLDYLHWDEAPAIVIITFNSAVTMLALASFCYMIKHRNTQLVKASGRELMVLIMIGILVQLSLIYIIIAKPTETTCFINRFMFGIDFTITYSAILIKSNRIYRIFSHGFKSARPPMWIKKYQQLVSAFSIIFMQLLIVITLVVMYPPITEEYQPSPDVVEITCAVEEVAILVPLGFNLLLILPCLYYGWKTRSLPANFKESRYIGFTVATTLVIWIAFIPVYLTVGTSESVSSEIRVEILAIVELMSAFNTLACFFFPKVYALKFVPTSSWHVTPSLRKSNSYALSQCDNCGSIYNKSIQSTDTQPNSRRGTSVIVHSVAQSNELNQHGRIRASSFGEAMTKIQRKRSLQASSHNENKASNRLERSTSVPDLAFLFSDDAVQSQVERSKTDLVIRRSTRSRNKRAAREFFYLHIATPISSRKPSVASMFRRQSSVTPLDVGSAEKHVAFVDVELTDQVAKTRNRFLAPPSQHHFNPSPTVQHPNVVPSPRLNNDSVNRNPFGNHLEPARSASVKHVTSPLPSNGFLGRERSSSDATQWRRNRENAKRRNSTDVQTEQCKVNPKLPSSRVVAYSVASALHRDNMV